jgi:hypothetical protein
MVRPRVLTVLRLITSSSFLTSPKVQVCGSGPFSVESATDGKAVLRPPRNASQIETYGW